MLLTSVYIQLLIMAAVAEWRIARFLASAQINRISFFCGKFDWLKICTLVRAITERLVLALTAGTPVVGLSLLDFAGVRIILWAYWFRHDFSCCVYY